MNNVAILGYGVVGKGVKTLLEKLSEKEDVQLVKVFDLPFRKEELKDLLVTDYHEISEDPSISIVFEALGGDDLPYQAITACLSHGKSVITSNKETVSKHLDEYLSLAKKNNCKFLFEASVGGGIPLLCNVIDLAKYDTITSFMGILNGTSNYILTRVFKDGKTFADALKEAQDNGYAERDPSADLNGTDLLRKGVILSSLAFHKKVDYKQVYNFGIEKLNNEIVNKINEMNKVLKLVVQGSYQDDKLYLMVQPVLLEKGNLLANTNYAFNNVLIDFVANDTLSFYGKGAGSIPTASAMIHDAARILHGKGDIDRSDAKQADVNINTKDQYLVYKNAKFDIINISCAEDLKQYDFIAKIVD